MAPPPPGPSILLERGYNPRRHDRPETPSPPPPAPPRLGPPRPGQVPSPRDRRSRPQGQGGAGGARRRHGYPDGRGPHTLRAAETAGGRAPGAGGREPHGHGLSPLRAPRPPGARA